MTLTEIQKWPRITRGENEGNPRFARIHEVEAYWLLRITTNARDLTPESYHPNNGSYMMRGDTIYSYSSHFPLATIIRKANGWPRLILCNGDSHGGGGGFGNSTSGQQLSVQGAIARIIKGTKIEAMTVPFSTLDAAGIQRDSIKPIEIRPDRDTFHERSSSEAPGRFARVDSGETEMVEVDRHGYHVNGTLCKYDTPGATWGAYKVQEERAILVDDPNRAHVERNEAHSWPEGDAKRGEDGIWRWTVRRHWLGETLFRAHTSETRTRKLTPAEMEQVSTLEALRSAEREADKLFWDLPVERRTYTSPEWLAYVAAGEARRAHSYPDGYMSRGQQPCIRYTVRRWSTYLSSFDYSEPHRPYFMCELARGFTPETVDQAIACLMPNEVAEAIDSGLEVLRQGDVFAIPTSLTTKELKSRARTFFRTVYVEDGDGQMVPDEILDAVRSKLRDDKHAMVLGTNHAPTHAILTKDGDWYGKGRLYHTPGAWRTPDHRVVKLGDGQTWYRMVKNTVPLDKASGSSRGSASAMVSTANRSGDSRAWTISGAVD